MADDAAFRARVIQDALAQGSAAYWERRADQFEAARPRPGDFTGHATPERIAATDERCAKAAAECRRRAEHALATTTGLIA